ncbi:FadR/GntR family transcriptional regulator [Tropicibacter sp. S64]|uniref:FadR/GntR family transcriptional regulator n=1 Tax=Tropicibacter sp. S64 TaxID=3415122 RepID=UPI003C7B568D
MVTPISRRALWMHKLTDEVVRAVTEKIHAGALSPGDALPPVETLAREHVTSITVIDRALDALVTSGTIAESPDGGFIVATPGPAGRFELPDTPATREDIIAVLELRMGVEVLAAGIAAERRDAAMLEEIRTAAAAFEAAAAEKDGIAQADYVFHRAVAMASGNPYIRELLEYLGPLLIPRMRITLPGRNLKSDGNLTASIAEHAAITRAIAAQEPAAARDAMRAHLGRAIALIRGMG